MRTVQRAAGPDEALALANCVPQALAASAWTADLTAALDLTARLHAGETWLNCHLAQSAELPHSGRGASGHGTDLSSSPSRSTSAPRPSPSGSDGTGWPGLTGPA
ncbi:aldehyde dehydrogenase family protein [Kitasatospora sp. NPDC001603]|uniref:aldehyde dehydrogenase family protein n=1 Tax=Kitasatospora sp. NPDC001603 TaxID=3154388 RepID=UPI00332F5DB0